MNVSVIIPCFNVSNYIEEAVDSVTNQSFLGVKEIICVDNNSTDNTWQILERLKLKHPTLVLRKEEKAGANAARNTGLRIASGQWIQLLDADDLLEPEKIEHQINLIQRNRKEPAFIAAAYKQYSTDGRLKKNHPLCDDKFLGTFINKAGITSGNLWNKEWLERVNYLDESLRSSQEADLMMRLILAGGEYLIDHKELTIIRERESGQISQSDPVKKWRQYLEVRLNYLKNLKHSKPEEYNRLKPQFHDFLMVSIITLGKYNVSLADHYFLQLKNEAWQSAGTHGMGKLKVWFIKSFGLQWYIKLTGGQEKKN